MTARDRQRRPEFSRFLDTVVKGGAAGLGLFYGLGLIVSSVRLAQLGVFSVDFAKPLYVLTGAWVCLPLAIATSLFVAWLATWRQFAGSLVKRVLSVSIVIPILGASEIWIIVLLANFSNTFFLSNGFGEYFALCIAINLIVPLFWVAVLHHLWTEAASHLLRYSLMGGFTVIIGLMYLVLFSMLVYVQIPPQLGGGAERIFALDVEEPRLLATLTGSRVAKSPVITPVYAETTESYVLPAPHAKREEFSLNWLLNTRVQTDWSSTNFLDSSFIVVPKRSISAATVIGLRSPKDREDRVVQRIWFRRQ